MRELDHVQVIKLLLYCIFCGLIHGCPFKMLNLQNIGSEKIYDFNLGTHLFFQQSFFLEMPSLLYT